MTLSYLLFRDYSRHSHHLTWQSDDNLDPEFQSAVTSAIASARGALNICEAESDDPQYRPYRRRAINDLAYHLATLYQHRPDRMVREEAMNLAKRLAEEAEYDFNYLDTIAWVKLKCDNLDPEFQSAVNDSSSDEYAAGKDILQSLLKRGDATDYARWLMSRDAEEEIRCPLGARRRPRRLVLSDYRAGKIAWLRSECLFHVSYSNLGLHTVCRQGCPLTIGILQKARA